MFSSHSVPLQSRRAECVELDIAQVDSLPDQVWRKKSCSGAIQSLCVEVILPVGHGIHTDKEGNEGMVVLSPGVPLDSLSLSVESLPGLCGLLACLVSDAPNLAQQALPCRLSLCPGKARVKQSP